MCVRALGALPTSPDGRRASLPQDKHLLVTRLNGKALPSTPEEWQLLHPDGDYMRDRDVLLPGAL